MQISGHASRYYLQISADIYEGKCYNTIHYIICSRHNYHVSAAARRSRTPQGPIVFVAFVSFVATASLLAAAAVTSSSRPPSPRGALPSFSGGGGGCVVIVVVIRVHAPHVAKETPGIVVVRMGDDDRPYPTTTRHALPLWQRRRDAVHGCGISMKG